MNDKIEKAIELLIEHCGHPIHITAPPRIADAIALLRSISPEAEGLVVHRCKICERQISIPSKRVHDTMYSPVCCDWPMDKVYPQPKPTPSPKGETREFIADARQRFEKQIRHGGFEAMWLGETLTKLSHACDHIDRLEAENAKGKEGIISLAKEVNRLEANLAAAQELTEADNEASKAYEVVIAREKIRNTHIRGLNKVLANNAQSQLNENEQLRETLLRLLGTKSRVDDALNKTKATK